MRLETSGGYGLYNTCICLTFENCILCIVLNFMSLPFFTVLKLTTIYVIFIDI